MSSKLLSNLPPKESHFDQRLESEKSQVYMDEIEEDQIEKSLIFTTHHVSEEEAQKKISRRIHEYQKSQLKYAKKCMAPQKYMELKRALESKSHLGQKVRCGFKEGQQILRKWNNRIDYKYDNCFYHHQRREEEPTPQLLDPTDATFVHQKDEIMGVVKHKLENEITAQVVGATDRVIQHKIKHNIRFNLDEFTVKHVQRQLPHIPTKYLMHNLSGNVDEEKLKALGGSTVARTQIQSVLLDEVENGAHATGAVSPDKVGIEPTPIYGRVKEPDISQEAARFMLQNMDYSCASFKQLVREAFSLVNFSRPATLEEQNETKNLANQRYYKVVDSFVKYLRVRGQFLEKEFLLKRYSKLSPLLKLQQVEIDLEKFEQPRSLIKERQLQHISEKLSKVLMKPVREILEESAEHPNALKSELADLDHQDKFQLDLYVELIIAKLKSESVEKDLIKAF